MKLDLGDGQSADLRERLSYSAARDVRRVFIESGEDRRAMADVDIAMVRAYVSSWTVLDTEGKAVPLDAPEQAPDDIIQAIAAKALDLWNGRADPKGSAGSGTTTPPA